MKSFLPALIVTCMVAGLLTSCSKSDSNTTNNSSNALLKSIYQYDTTYLLCGNCPPVITKTDVRFVYDAQGRVTQRLVIATKASAGAVTTIDTTNTFTYTYTGGSSKVTGYTEQEGKASPVIHELTYDAQDRLIKDSVTNPQPSNNKVTTYTYFTNMYLQKDKQTVGISSQFSIDTFYFSGSNVVKQALQGGARTITYTISSTLRNPLSYTNTFSLLGSDWRNGINGTIYNIYTPFYNTYNMTTKCTMAGSSGSPVVGNLSIVIDAGNSNVVSFANSANGNRQTFYEYY